MRLSRIHGRISCWRKVLYDVFETSWSPFWQPHKPSRSIFLCVNPLGAVCVLRRRQPRVLTESADQLLERFGLRFRLARLVTGAFEIGSNGPLVEIQEGNEGETISSRGGFTSLYESGSMKSFLETEVNRERGRGGRGSHQNPKLAP
jgi:hypothetical protein